MDYKKSKAPLTAITRDVINYEKKTGNIYETVMILAKRANQINVDLKQELSAKLQEFSTTATDNLDEIFENREQIEISKYYERLPKPTLIATQEFDDDEIVYRMPEKSEEEGENLD